MGIEEKLAMLEGEMDNLRHRVAQLEAELEEANRIIQLQNDLQGENNGVH